MPKRGVEQFRLYLQLDEHINNLKSLPYSSAGGYLTELKTNILKRRDKINIRNYGAEIPKRIFPFDFFRQLDSELSVDNSFSLKYVVDDDFAVAITAQKDHQGGIHCRIAWAEKRRWNWRYGFESRRRGIGPVLEELTYDYTSVTDHSPASLEVTHKGLESKTMELRVEEPTQKEEVLEHPVEHRGNTYKRWDVLTYPITITNKDQQVKANIEFVDV